MAEEFKIDKHNSVIAESESTRSGFRHVVILMRDGHEIDRDKVTYINRTWESFPFETALGKILNKHPEIKPAVKKKFFERASGRHVEEVESQFRTTANIAKLGNILTNTPKERADWKERMLKAGLPDLQIPEDWNELSDKEREARLDRVIEMMGKKTAKKKKNIEEVS